MSHPGIKRTIERAEAERRYAGWIQFCGWEMKPSLEWWWYFEETKSDSGEPMLEIDPDYLSFEQWMKVRGL